jgi:hypothetical protein
LLMDAQLLLLRAASRAGITRFVARSWSYDWSAMPLGIQDSSDPLISFRSHVEVTSGIRPIYISCGVLAEVLIAFHGEWGAANHGVWDPDGKRMDSWGKGERFGIGRLRDAAEFAVEIVLRDDAVDGGLGRFVRA